MTGNFARGTRMLRDDQRGARLVVADARHREFGLRDRRRGAVQARPGSARPVAPVRPAATPRPRGSRRGELRASSCGNCTWRSVAAGRKPNPVPAAPTFQPLPPMTTIPLGPRLLAGSSDLPGDFGRAVRLTAPTPSRQSASATLFGLAPCGVLPATRVTTSAVRSYRTFSPLPFDSRRPLGRRSLRASPERRHPRRSKPEGRYIFCATSPSGCPARALPGALPCGVRTFLSSRHFAVTRGYRKQRSSGRLRPPIMALAGLRSSVSGLRSCQADLKVRLYEPM